MIMPVLDISRTFCPGYFKDIFDCLDISSTFLPWIFDRNFLFYVLDILKRRLSSIFPSHFMSYNIRKNYAFLFRFKFGIVGREVSIFLQICIKNNFGTNGILDTITERVFASLLLHAVICSFNIQVSNLSILIDCRLFYLYLCMSLTFISI